MPADRGSLVPQRVGEVRGADGPLENHAEVAAGEGVADMTLAGEMARGVDQADGARARPLGERAAAGGVDGPGELGRPAAAVHRAGDGGEVDDQLVPGIR